MYMKDIQQIEIIALRIWTELVQVVFLAGRMITSLYLCSLTMIKPCFEMKQQQLWPWVSSESRCGSHPPSQQDGFCFIWNELGCLVTELEWTEKKYKFSFEMCLFFLPRTVSQKGRSLALVVPDMKHSPQEGFFFVLQNIYWQYRCSSYYHWGQHRDQTIF